MRTTCVLHPDSVATTEHIQDAQSRSLPLARLLGNHTDLVTVVYGVAACIYCVELTDRKDWA